MSTMAMQSFGLDAVNISFLPSDDGNSTKSLPLVISPRWEKSLDFLCTWFECNRPFLADMMLQCGAVLARGFEIQSCGDFERAALAAQPNLNNCYRGTSPRDLQPGTDYVFSAAEVPTHYPIAQHIEMSFLPAPPRQLMFSCMKASMSPGGETALCDFRKVYRDLDPEIRQKLFDKKIRYTRTHQFTGSYWTFDVSDMVGWPELFETSEKREVERICREEGVPMSWEGPDNDCFVSVTQSEPFQHHPISKEPVWFNHSQVFHWTTFPVELFYAFLRTYELKLLLHCVLVSIFCVVNYGLLGRKMSLDSTFGDGTPISIREMHEIRKVIHRNMIFNRWKTGDLLMIDNFSTSHGRQPTYDHGRKVVVAWSNPMQKTNTLTSKEAEKVLIENKEPQVLDNPQERTPESTLTNEDAQQLKQAVLEKRLSTELVKDNGAGVILPTINPQELEDALQGALIRQKVHRRVHSQPALHPASDFWKKMS